MQGPVSTGMGDHLLTGKWTWLYLAWLYLSG